MTGRRALESRKETRTEGGPDRRPAGRRAGARVALVIAILAAQAIGSRPASATPPAPAPPPGAVAARPARWIPTRGAPPLSPAATAREPGSVAGERLPSPTAAGRAAPPPPAAAAGGWVDLLVDGFEGSDDPRDSGWQLFWQTDNHYTWFGDDFNPHTDTTSVWCADLSDRTPQFPDREPEDGYPDDMFARMAWGPFDLSDATMAELQFWYWLDSEVDGDFLIWRASIDGSDYAGFRTSGLADWTFVTFDLTDVPFLGNLAGQDSVWIALDFDSNETVNAQGAFIDDVVIRKFVPVSVDCEVEPTALDVGDVPIGASGFAGFRIRNLGNDVLAGTVTPNCPGFDFVVVGDPSYNLAPGQSDSFTVAFIPIAAGPSTCTFEVGAGCADVVAQGNGVEAGPACGVLPTLLDFGSVEVGSDSLATFTITNLTLDVFLADTASVVQPCDDFEIVGDGGYSIPPGASFPISVRFAPSSEGVKQCQVDPGAGCVPVSVLGTGTPAPVCAVQPDTLDFGDVDLGSTPELTFTIRNAGAGVLGGVVSACLEFTIVGDPSYSLAAGQTDTITVRFTPIAEGLRTCTIDLGNAACTGVEARGSGVAAPGPVCSVTPSGIDFGQVMMGSSATPRAVRIQNLGPATLSGTVTESCGDFAILSDPSYSLAPGESTDIFVTFTPTSAGPTSCQLDPGNASCPAVLLEGTGLANLACAVAPTLLDFGDRPLGSPADLTFSILNKGQVALNGTVSESCDDFELVDDDLTYSLNTGQADTFTVRFTPGAPGLATCTIDTGAGVCEDVIARGTGLENSPPTIAHTPVQTAAAATPLVIQADVGDAEGPVSATLHYRRGGDAGFTAVDMAAAAVMLSATIPDSAVTSRGVEYYIAATDGELQTFDPPVDYDTAPHVVGVQAARASNPDPQPGGGAQTAYRMISVPGTLVDPRSQSVLADDLGAYDDTQWRFFRYEGGTLVEFPAAPADSIEVAAAYWLISRRGGVTIDAASVTSQSTGAPFTISLDPGWNDIGLPFDFPVRWSDVEIDSQLADGPYTYTGTWLPPTAVSQLVPWQGYSVFNSSASALSMGIPPVAADATPGVGTAGEARAPAAPPAMAGAPAAADWSLRLSARCEAARDTYNDLGWAPTAVAGHDVWDHVEPRPMGEYVRVVFPHEDWGRRAGDYTSDFRGPAGAGDAWRLRVETNIAGAPVELTWAGLETLPAGFGAALLDRQLGVRIDLGADAAYTLRGPPPHELLLVVGAAGFVAAQAEMQLPPARLRLLAALPNPFATATVIRYQLDVPSAVTLRVYDATGRIVATLADRMAEPGLNEVLWDGTDDRGRPRSSGLFFYRLEAGDRIATGRVLLLR